MRQPVQNTGIGIRGGDRGGSHGRPLEVCDDSVSLNAADWNRENYIDSKGQSRVRMTRRK